MSAWSESPCVSVLTRRRGTVPKQMSMESADPDGPILVGSLEL